MKPGRELDALVAEKVMRLQVELKKFPYPYGEDYAFHRFTRGGALLGFAPVPRYSTSIAAAWLIVETIGPKHGFTAEIKPGTNEVKMTFAEDRNNVPAESAPHAICLAALQVVGGPE